MCAERATHIFLIENGMPPVVGAQWELPGAAACKKPLLFSLFLDAPSGAFSAGAGGLSNIQA